jgi:hypothetical protein
LKNKEEILHVLEEYFINIYLREDHPNLGYYSFRVKKDQDKYDFEYNNGDIYLWKDGLYFSERDEELEKELNKRLNIVKMRKEKLMKLNEEKN